MSNIPSNSVAMILTSPPYPMIEMWDGLFSQADSGVAGALANEDGMKAFDLIHERLDKTWLEVNRILINGGIACINIGDATRKIGDSFRVYSNHQRIIAAYIRLGFDVLPEIIWRKQTNKPNKFMGSGTLPVGAYVTSEHEYILVLRKGQKRAFSSDEQKLNRRRSAFFWEERNRWFSDAWEDIKGDRQLLNNVRRRDRSAAFPFDLAYRLICMFSVQQDMVVDPFVGTGTTTLAAMASSRNSICFEIDPSLANLMKSKIIGIVETANEYNDARIEQHAEFVNKSRRHFRHTNRNYGRVMMEQEVDLTIPRLIKVEAIGDMKYEVTYSTRVRRIAVSQASKLINGSRNGLIDSDG